MARKRRSKKKWIKPAIKRPGALRKALGVKEGRTIPAGKLATAAKKPGRLGRQARMAQILKRLAKKRAQQKRLRRKGRKKRTKRRR